MDSKILDIIQEELKAAKYSVVDLVQSYLNQIKATEEFNAYVEVFETEAIDKAQLLDKKLASGETLGALFGAVISIKDNICYKGHLATAGSKMLSGFKAPYSATVVERLLKEDAIIIGRTNCDEFSMGSTNETSYYGPVLNALDKTKVAGGSSGGAAVSVKLGTCLAAIGSDTGGSIRQPASFNGVVGYKPSYGVVSRWGLIAYGSSFDQMGILTEKVSNISKIMEVISGPDNYDATALRIKLSFQSIESVGKRKLVWFSNFINESVLDKPMFEACSNYIDKLAALGYEIEEREFPFMEYLVPCYYVLCTAEASSNLSRYDGIRFGHKTNQEMDDYRSWIMQNRTEGFGKEVKKRIILGNYVLSEGYFDAYYRKAQKVRKLIKDYFDELYNTVDLVVLPVTSTPAWTLGESFKDPLKMYLSDIFTVLSNLAGLPALSTPIYNKLNGLPFGIQLMCKPGEDAKLLAITAFLNEKMEI